MGTHGSVFRHRARHRPPRFLCTCMRQASQRSCLLRDTAPQNQMIVHGQSSSTMRYHGSLYSANGQLILGRPIGINGQHQHYKKYSLLMSPGISGQDMLHHIAWLPWAVHVQPKIILLHSRMMLTLPISMLTQHMHQIKRVARVRINGLYHCGYGNHSLISFISESAIYTCRT